MPGAASPLGEVDQQRGHTGSIAMTDAKVVGKPMEFPDRVVVRNLINGCFELHPLDFLAAERLTQQLRSGVGIRANRGRQALLCVGCTTIQKDARTSKQARQVPSDPGSAPCPLQPPPPPPA